MLAEVLINNILEYRENISDIRIDCVGSFQRNYLSDVAGFELSMVNAEKITLVVRVNRDSLYNKLPEGVFHKIDRFVKLGTSASKKNFKEEFEEQKKEIEYSRKFFQPFDNLFFNVSLLIEKKISENIANARKSIYDYFFRQTSLSNLSYPYREKIISFLPYLSKMRANIDHLGFFLSFLFQAEVSITQHEAVQSYQVESEKSYNQLGKLTLGKNFYCGNEYCDFLFQWIVSVKTRESNLHIFIDDQEFKKMFAFVKSLLLPAGVETVLDVKSYSIQHLLLQTRPPVEKRQYLGFNVTI